MANNFEFVLLSNQSIVSGDAESFCAGTGSITLTRITYNNGIKLKASAWDKVATIRWNETNYSSSNIGYYDSTNNWYSLSPSLSWSGSRLTITNLNMPAGTLDLFVGQETGADVTYSNLEILDANGNSLLEATEPSTGLPLYIGDSNIQAVKLGNVNISKMYIGDTLIYGHDEPAASNNFRIETTDSTFGVVDGTLEDFVSGNGYVQLRALSDPTYPTFNLYIDNSSIDFSMVKTIKFKRTIVSLNQNTSYNSNYGYYDSSNAWHYIAQNPSPVGDIMTFDNLDLPSDAIKFQFGCDSYLLRPNGEYKLEEFDVLDVNGNSILKS